MIELNPPQFSVDDVFFTCVDSFRDEHLRNVLYDAVGYVRAASDAFDQASNTSDWSSLTPDYKYEVPAPTNDLKALYDRQFARAGSSARHYYDEIMLTPRNRLCPYCGVGHVSQLDHFLPKSTFSTLAIKPQNLIPACADCNKNKGEQFLFDNARQYLNPYFDSFITEPWLKAQIDTLAPPVFLFFVDVDANLTEDELGRIKHHFYQLKLDETYSLKAAVQLASITRRLEKLLHTDGESGVREYLIEEAESREAENPNSWLAAMYRCSSLSDWFCKGGFAY